MDNEDRKMKKDTELRLLTQGDKEVLAKFKKRTKLEWSEKGEKLIVSDVLFDNLITTEELATILRVSSQTIRNWVARRKIPCVRIGRKNLFQKRSLQKWLNQKEEPLWE